MFIVFFYCITCISAVSENTINTTTTEIDTQNNLISLSYDGQLKISAENNSALITQNEILQQKNNNEILKATPKEDTIIIGKDYTLNHKPMPFIVYLKDNNNNPLKDLNVIFTINGVDYTRTTANDGSAKININLNPGNYPITYSFAGNNNYKATSGKSTIKIVTNKLQPTLNGDDLSKYHDETGQYKTYLKDNNGNPLINELIQIKINGVTYTRTTGNDGDATLNINLPAGKYTITTKYLGNDYYKTSTTKNTITVNKKATCIQGSDLTKYYGETIPYKVKLLDNNKKPLSKENVIFTVNGKIYTRTTNNNGIASLNINLKPEIYNITTKYNGNNQYLKSNILNGKIIINKSNSHIYCNNTNIILPENNYLSLTLLDNKNNGIANQNIIISFNDKNHTLKTDDMGNIKLKINNTEGLYKFKAIYLGNDYYSKSNIENILNITSNTFKYSILIPHYVNVTGIWRITDKIWWLDSNYISTYGTCGKIKIPVSRYLNIITKDKEYDYTIGYTDDENHINYGSSQDLILDKN